MLLVDFMLRKSSERPFDSNTIVMDLNSNRSYCVVVHCITLDTVFGFVGLPRHSSRNVPTYYSYSKYSITGTGVCYVRVCLLHLVFPTAIQPRLVLPLSMYSCVAAAIFTAVAVHCTLYMDKHTSTVVRVQSRLVEWDRSIRNTDIAHGRYGTDTVLG